MVNTALLAGRLGHFLPNWRRITNDPTILETIQGYKLEFTSTPVQSTVRRPLQFSCSETEKIDLEISALLEKEALHVVKPGFRSVYKQFVFGTETGREISPCDQSKGSEHIPSVRSFQNGGYPPSSRFTPASRLAGKDRPEGCVLRDSYLEESPEVPSVSLERHTSRVCVPSLWPGGCSEAFHLGYEAGCCSSSARRYPSDHLLGRSAVHESIAGGPGAGYGNCALLARESRVCCQFRQVMLRSNPAVGISRVSRQQSGYDSAPSRLQSGGNKSPLSLPASTSRRICPGVVSAHRETDGIHTGHISGSLALPISSAPETLSSSSAKRVRCNNSSVKRSQRRASLVVSPPRCTLHMNCLELLAGSFAVKSFAKGRLCAHVRLRMDNTSAVAYVNRLGGNTISRSVQFGSGPMRVGSQSEYFSKCRTLCRTHECYGRLAVPVMPRSLSGLDADSRALCQGPLSRQAEYPVASVLQLEAGSDGSRCRCPSAGLVEGKELCLSPVLPDHEGTGEVAGIRRGTDTSHAVVAHTGLVSHHPGHISVVTGSSAHEQQSPIRASREDTPTDREHDSPVNRVACIKRSLQSEGICANASKLIWAAWRPGTNAIYNSAWKKWHSWCLGRKVDSFRPTLADITGFLAHSFDEGLEYRTLNTYRSALSGVLPPIDGFPAQHPLVVRLLKGVPNLRPAMPRYQQSWNVNTVLTYLQTLPNNEDLSLRFLTQKLAILLAITAPKRSSELKLLDLRFMRILPEGAELQLPGLTKTSSEVISVFFAKYSELVV